MTDTHYNTARVRRANSGELNARGRYVLYWMQASRRLERNHALNYASALAARQGRPLVVYEGLRLDYAWASRRHHRFALEGMADNRREAAARGLAYWPFVETPDAPARGLLRRLAANAVAVVTDDWPCFVVPDQTAALAAKTDVPVFAVDGASVVPQALLGPCVSAAAHLRPRIHRAFAEAWAHRAGLAAAPARAEVAPPFALWDASDVGRFADALPLDPLPSVAGVVGGRRAGLAKLRAFVAHRLAGYAERRSHPSAPDEGHASGLSPYLRWGHVGIEDVVDAVLGPDWSTAELDVGSRGKREGFFVRDADVNSFLDEALTWRDVGLHWHRHRRADAQTLASALPTWAQRSLDAHASDPREAVYSLEAFDAADTHDPLWNAAQRELVATGTIHNYLRMLWGKKVLEWSRTPEDAYRTLVHLNNRYALDGRDPNSYTGILWCFGLFDRPWAPERPVYGVVRYMSSANTGKKFKLDAYRAYVASLGTP